MIEEKTGGGFTGAGIAEEVLGLAGGKEKECCLMASRPLFAFLLFAFVLLRNGWIFG